MNVGPEDYGRRERAVHRITRSGTLKRDNVKQSQRKEKKTEKFQSVPMKAAKKEEPKIGDKDV